MNSKSERDVIGRIRAVGNELALNWTVILKKSQSLGWRHVPGMSLPALVHSAVSLTSVNRTAAYCVIFTPMFRTGQFNLIVKRPDTQSVVLNVTVRIDFWDNNQPALLFKGRGELKPDTYTAYSLILEALSELKRSILV